MTDLDCWNPNCKNKAQSEDSVTCKDCAHAIETTDADICEDCACWTETAVYDHSGDCSIVKCPACQECYEEERTND